MRTWDGEGKGGKLKTEKQSDKVKLKSYYINYHTILI